MKIAIILDLDVQQLLREAAQRTGQSLDVTANEALRIELRKSSAPPTPFVVKSHSMGLRPGIDLNEIELEMDIEAYLRVTQNLLEERRKKPPAEGPSES